MVMSSRLIQESPRTAKKIVTNAIIGFVIIFTSYWLIQIISVVTGGSYFNPTPKFATVDLYGISFWQHRQSPH